MDKEQITTNISKRWVKKIAFSGAKRSRDLEKMSKKVCPTISSKILAKMGIPYMSFIGDRRGIIIP